MYLGKIMEEAPTEELFEKRMHPYTKALLSAIPSINTDKDMHRIILEGDVPSPINPPPGCRFYKRCRKAQPICLQKEPQLCDTEFKGHRVACHFAELDQL